MSRHRIVRSMNYEDERYEDDEYDMGHSYEDRYCVSPSTAAQFTFNRDRGVDLSSYMGAEEIPEENADDISMEATTSPKQDAASKADQALLHSCLDELHNILGDSISEAVLTDAVVRHNYNLEAALNEVLSHQDAPKPQRPQRKKRDHAQGVDGVREDISTQTKQSKGAFESSGQNGPTVITASTKKEAQKGFDTNNSFVEKPPSDAGTVGVSDAISVEGLNEEVAALTVETTLDKDKNPALAAISSSSSSRPSTPHKLDHPIGIPKSASRSKTDRIDAKAEYAKRQGDKDLINLVVIGHVDAGKSTLMGHLLYQLGSVQQRTMHKYEQESRKLGKSSFAFAWVLDETEEERSRGVTMDVAQTSFVTEKKMVTLLDAPGHKDFIPNMITGAAQADVAILVINATRGEFETGFELGGQTREHALLARSLGVSQMIVAVNKMDTVDWDQLRYDEIVKKLRQYLKQVGFKEADISFIPCSGLAGENLAKPAEDPKLTAWYKGCTLVQQIDQFKNMERPVDKPFRYSVSDIFKGSTGGFSIAGRISAGYIRPGDKVLVMPAGSLAGIKTVMIDEVPAQIAFAGDQVTMVLTGIDIINVNLGSILCDPTAPVRSATRIRAKIVIFNLEVPMTRGIPVSFKSFCRLPVSCLTKNSSAVVEIEFERSLCLELYADYRDLGRFMLRQGGHTIAAGLVEEVGAANL
ncbi:hypothetical protein C0Q70_16057 [Pomacea canaliculata]|uniref:Tr-type G domain-containing protein n=1 Tax=Pomacea canaliculata TaxID=400727 RepID=A0A2T7NNP9_POMCA|nr:hypothetical protein C0Q70_16057 [Pomacea canaliculata]